MPEQFLTTREVAGLLKITIPTLHKLTHNGSIRGYKVGNRTRFKQEDIVNSLNEITNPLKPLEHGQ